MAIIATTVTKKGIQLLHSDIVTYAVDLIEKELPGWWWSISQRHKDISVSVGPSKYSPHYYDVILAETKIGDRGYVYSLFVTDQLHQDQFLNWLAKLFPPLNAQRRVIQRQHPTGDGIELQPTYRRQDKDNLRDLKTKYDLLLETVPLMESHGHLLNEIYLGSCEISVDCSLRGTRSDETEFDISVDLGGYENCLADSLRWAIAETMSDILTPSEPSV